MIDGGVQRVARWRKHNPRGRDQTAEAVAAHFRPARPAVVEPPVVMMRNEWNVAFGTSGSQFASKKRISAYAEIVRPDEAILAVGIREQLCYRLAESRGDSFG
jgi:hypothetical protein